MQYASKKLCLFVVLITSIRALAQDPVIFLKNNTNHTVQVQMKLTTPLADSMIPTDIAAGSTYSDAKVPAKKVWGLTIKYCSSNTCAGSSPYDKEYAVKFNNSFTKKYYIDFSIDNNLPILTPQQGISGNIVQEKIVEISGKPIMVGTLENVPQPKAQSIVDQSATMTQSEAHMSLNVIREEVERVYNFSKNPYYKKLYRDVVARERKHQDCYVLYNAFSNEWLIPQELYLALYKRFHVLTFNIENFRAFRWIPISHVTPKEFLKNELKAHGMVNDNEWRVKSYLLSTNLALFGNIGFPGECTFEYFLNAKSQTKISVAVFKSILDIFDDPAKYPTGTEPMLYKYIPQISALDDLLKVDPLPNGKQTGTLSQIFIPKNLINDVAYLSWVGGVPYEEKMVNWVLTEAQNELGEMPLYKRTANVLGDIKQLFKDKKETHPLFEKILTGIEECKYCMAQILEEYVTYPKLVPGLNNMQARLILSAEYVGNPNSGVKMYEYDRIKPDAKERYEKALNNIVNSIIEDIRMKSKS